MQIKNLNLTLLNATGEDEECVNAKKTAQMYQCLEGKDRELMGFVISVKANYDDELKVKFPLSESICEKIAVLNRCFEKAETVRIYLRGTKMQVYAYRDDSGNYITGVSATADDFEIDPYYDDLFDAGSPIKHNNFKERRKKT